MTVLIVLAVGLIIGLKRAMMSESGFKRVRNEYNEVSVDIASILKMKKNTEVKTDSLLINY